MNRTSKFFHILKFSTLHFSIRLDKEWFSSMLNFYLTNQISRRSELLRNSCIIRAIQSDPIPQFSCQIPWLFSIHPHSATIHREFSALICQSTILLIIKLKDIFFLRTYSNGFLTNIENLIWHTRFEFPIFSCFVSHISRLIFGCHFRD